MFKKSYNFIFKKIIVFILALLISFFSVLEKKESYAIALVDDAIVVFFVLGCCSIAGIQLATNKETRKAVEDCIANTKENLDEIKKAAYDYYKIAILKTTGFLSDAKKRIAEIGEIQRSLVKTLVDLGYQTYIKPKIDESLYPDINRDLALSFANRSMYFNDVDGFLSDVQGAYSSFGGFRFNINNCQILNSNSTSLEYTYNLPFGISNSYSLYFEKFNVSYQDGYDINTFNHAGFYLPKTDSVLNQRDSEVAGSESGYNQAFQEVEDFYKSKAPVYFYSYDFYQPDSPNPMGSFCFFSLGAIQQFTQGLHYWLTAYTFTNRELTQYAISQNSIALNKSLSPGQFQDFAKNYNSDIGMIKGQLDDILSQLSTSKSYIDYLLKNYKKLDRITDDLACEVTDLGLKVNSLPNALDYNNLYNTLNGKIDDVNTNLRNMIDTLDSRVGTVESSLVNIDNRVSALDISVGNINTRVKAIDRTLPKIKADVDTLTNTVADVNAKVDSIPASITNAIAPVIDFFKIPAEKDKVKVDLDKFKSITLPKKFPFSLPFDFYNILKMIVSEPVEPKFEQNISYKNIGNDETFNYKFKIDFDIIKPLIKPFKGFVFIIYIIALIFVTKKILS